MLIVLSTDNTVTIVVGQDERGHKMRNGRVSLQDKHVTVKLRQRYDMLQLMNILKLLLMCNI